MKIYITTEKKGQSVRATLEIDEFDGSPNATYKYPGLWHSKYELAWKNEVSALAEWIGAMSDAIQDAQNKAARIEIDANPEYLPKHLMSSEASK